MSQTSGELGQPDHSIAKGISRFLARQGSLERDAYSCYLASDGMEEDSMNQVLDHSLIYCMAKHTSLPNKQ
jgi:hypothetical protein